MFMNPPFWCVGLLDQAYEQLKEAAYLYGRVCDDLDPEACNCNSLLAKVTFLQGKAAEVCSQLPSLSTSDSNDRVLADFKVFQLHFPVMDSCG